jgi:hypothetical protein
MELEPKSSGGNRKPAATTRDSNISCIPVGRRSPHLVVPGNRCGLNLEDLVEDADVSFTAGSVDEDLGLAGAIPFESLLKQTTLLRHVSGGVVARPQLQYENHRGRIHDTLGVIKALPPPMSPSSSSPGSSPLIRRSSSPPTALWSRQMSPSHSALN